MKLSTSSSCWLAMTQRSRTMPRSGLERDGLTSSTSSRAVEAVAGAHRLEPAQLVDPGRAHRRGAIQQAVREQAHERAHGMPAARDQPAIDRSGGRLLVEVERLRIPVPGEGDDLVPTERAPAQMMDLAGGEIVEVDFGHA